eukprot:538834-Prorocentrum_minimum.AAC.2
MGPTNEPMGCVQASAAATMTAVCAEVATFAGALPTTSPAVLPQLQELARRLKESSTRVQQVGVGTDMHRPYNIG